MAISENEASRRHRRLMRRLTVLNLVMLAGIAIILFAWLTGKDGTRPGGLTAGENSRQEESAAPPSKGPGTDGSAGQSGDGGGANGSAGQSGDGGGANGSAGQSGDGGGAAGSAGQSGDGGEAGGNAGQSGNGCDADGSAGQSGNGGGADGSAGQSGNGGGANGNAGQSGEEERPDDSGAKVRLAFVGDLLLASSVEELMRKNGYDYPYRDALPYLTEPDLTAGNLENPITKRGTPAEDKQYVFKGRPESLDALKEAGFDVVSVANNHTLDQGVVGLLDTIDYLDEAGIRHMGGGRNEEEAYRPAVLEAQGVKVAYLGFSRVLPVVEWKATKEREGLAEAYDSTRALEAIRKAKEDADLIVVMVHWGRERVDHPVEHQKVLAKQFIDAGADLVIGSHPHVLQGFERYKGKWIAYSLGNFIFNMTATLKTRDTGVLDCVCSKAGDCELKFHPMRAEQSKPSPMDKTSAAKLIAHLNDISFGVKIHPDGTITAKDDDGKR
ncbi:CapA family protein [Paenibacillus cisolokensis]|nr:CapA family protein [Paenibacillus cisolokensis]